MVKVHFTVDVEVWCGWQDMDARFPEAFRRYVYGPTTRGDHGLPLTLSMLDDHGLAGVFFVEALFAARFGLEPLAEIVGLVREAGHEIQLHVHPEWADEARAPLLPVRRPKQPYLHGFPLEEQAALVGAGRELLQQAGAPRPTAFRAGSFGIDRASLDAVARCGIAIDASYDAAMREAMRFDVDDEAPLVQATRIGTTLEVPMTVFRDARQRLRHLQLGAASSSEIEAVLWHAHEHGWPSVVMLSHNFELLNQAKTRPDDIVVARFRRLCRFLAANRDCFETAGFGGVDLDVDDAAQPSLPQVSMPATARRYCEQLWRRVYQ